VSVDVWALAADMLTGTGPVDEGLQDHQRPPEGRWDGWLLQAGRDSGKTYAAVRWLAAQARRRPGLRGRIIAPTLADAVQSCVRGPSGLLEADRTVRYVGSRAGEQPLVEWPNGSTVWLVGTPTVQDCDRLRALTNIDVDHFEEAAANRQLSEAVRQARLSRRRAGARWIATTTPRPHAVLRGWRDDETVQVTRASSYDNVHADRAWLAKVEAEMGGTRLYRQEVLGELLDHVEGALWDPGWIERSRVAEPPGLLTVAVGVDPADSGTVGIVVVGLGVDGHIYILEDVSMTGASGEQWGVAVAAAAARWGGVVVVESDYGGDAVAAVVRTAGFDVSVHKIKARGRGGKADRALPVSTLWEVDPARGHVVGQQARLEDEMTLWVPGSAESPDRLDAMVHATAWLTESRSSASVQQPDPGMRVPVRQR